jgi:hypothetical protein
MELKIKHSTNGKAVDRNNGRRYRLPSAYEECLQRAVFP